MQIRPIIFTALLCTSLIPLLGVYQFAGSKTNSEQSVGSTWKKNLFSLDTIPYDDEDLANSVNTLLAHCENNPNTPRVLFIGMNPDNVLYSNPPDDALSSIEWIEAKKYPSRDFSGFNKDTLFCFLDLGGFCKQLKNPQFMMDAASGDQIGMLFAMLNFKEGIFDQIIFDHNVMKELPWPYDISDERHERIKNKAAIWSSGARLSFKTVIEIYSKLLKNGGTLTFDYANFAYGVLTNEAISQYTEEPSNLDDRGRALFNIKLQLEQKSKFPYLSMQSQKSRIERDLKDMDLGTQFKVKSYLPGEQKYPNGWYKEGSLNLNDNKMPHFVLTKIGKISEIEKSKESTKDVKKEDNKEEVINK